MGGLKGGVVANGRGAPRGYRRFAAHLRVYGMICEADDRIEGDRGENLVALAQGDLMVRRSRSGDFTRRMRRRRRRCSEVKRRGPQRDLRGAGHERLVIERELLARCLDARPASGGRVMAGEPAGISAVRSARYSGAQCRLIGTQVAVRTGDGGCSVVSATGKGRRRSMP